MKAQILTLLVLGLVLIGAPVASAQDTKNTPTTTPTPVPITVTRAWLQGYRQDNPNVPTTRADAGFRNRLIVEVEGLSDAVLKDKINPRDLVLYLNGQALKGVNAVSIEGPKQNWLGFDLQRTDASNPVWRSLLGSPGWTDNHRLVSVSVGFPDKQAIPATPGYQPQMYLRLYYRWWAIISLVVLLGIIITFILAVRNGYLLRDTNPPFPPAGLKKPYSLALTQAAWWFFLVFGSFGFIYMITGDYNTMTDQALILMGIGTGTALGAFMVNATKRDTADNELSTLRPEKARIAAEVEELIAKNLGLRNKISAAGATPSADDQAALRDSEIVLAEKQAKLVEIVKKIEDAKSGLSKPVSESFSKDLLTDANGIALHRFQMMIWTIVLGIVFGLAVYRNLSMPEFSTTLLALMGISAGTYLGFKIPERQQ